MRSSFALLAMLLFVASVRGETPEWPQFRGPHASGIAEDEKPPVEIGPDKNVKWKVAVPSGLSSPIIVGDKVVITALDDGKLYTIAYRRSDGGEVWRADAGAKDLEPYLATESSPAASTSATDGERIVSYFGSCGLRCYDLSGNELWKLEMPPASLFGGVGSGVSPIIAEGTVILLRDEANDPKIVAVDLATGDVQWEKERESRAGYCTPAIWQTPHGAQVAAPGFGKMIGYDLASGDEKWHVVGMPAATCASPVAANGDLYFAAWSHGDPSEPSEFKMPAFDEVLKQAEDADGDGAISRDEAVDDWKSSFDSQDLNKDGKISRDEWEEMERYLASARNSAFALKPGGTGDITDSHMRWKQTKGLPYVSSAILYRGQYLMVKDGGIVTAYDAKNGEQIYHRRAVALGSYHASPVAANGNIYFASLADGIITVLKGGTDQPEKVAENPPLGERVAATPAIADDTLYIRTAGHLYAFAENK